MLQSTFIATLNRTNISMFFHNFVKLRRRILFVSFQNCMINQFIILTFHNQSVISFYIKKLFNLFSFICFLNKYYFYRKQLLRTKNFSMQKPLNEN